MERLIITAGAKAACVRAFEATGAVVLAVPPTAEEVTWALDAAETDEGLCELPIGLYGAGRGARAVLEAAVARPSSAAAVVAMSRLFEPTLLERVRTPTLLLTADRFRRLCELPHEHCEQVEPRDDAHAARLATAWFERHVGAAQRERWVPGAEGQEPFC